MRYSSNPVPPDICDVLGTAIVLAAEELAKDYPLDSENPEIDSVKTWKNYLLQQAKKMQDQMTEEQRFAFRQKHFPPPPANP
jgi:hypothetical protein